MNPVLQYVSDLHLEARRRWPVIPAKAPVLLLAGDIGTPKKETLQAFLADVASRFKLVIYVPGNHEYYGNTIEQTEALLKELLEPYANIVYLKDRSILIQDLFRRPVRVVGSTLWAPCPDGVSDLRDFQKIFVGEPARRFGPGDMRALYARSCEFLERELRDAPDVDTVVVTHHAPLEETNGAFVGHPAAAAYASDMKHLMHDHVRAWVYGHTHVNMTTRVRNCVVTTNALGYPGEKVDNFRPVALLEL